MQIYSSSFCFELLLLLGMNIDENSGFFDVKVSYEILTISSEVNSVWGEKRNTY